MLYNRSQECGEIAQECEENSREAIQQVKDQICENLINQDRFQILQ